MSGCSLGVSNFQAHEIPELEPRPGNFEISNFVFCDPVDVEQVQGINSSRMVSFLLNSCELLRRYSSTGDEV